jgi:hypothetical protein
MDRNWPMDEKKTNVDPSPTKATVSVALFVTKDNRTDCDVNGLKVEDSNLVITSQLIERQVL